MQMFHVSRRMLFLLLIVALAMGLFSVSAVGAQGLARVRVAHLSPDTPAVEIFVNGQPSGIQTLTFNEISGWVELPAGTYSVAVAPAGAGIEAAAIGPASFTLGSNSWTTIAAIGSLSSGSLRAATIREDYTPLDTGQTRVTVFHAIEDAPAVDIILADGTRLAGNLRFGSSATLNVPGGVYDLAVVAAGTTGPAVINLGGTVLNNQTYYFVAATNTLANPQVALSRVALSAVAPLINKPFPAGTIAEIASRDTRFSTLVTALQAAGLVDVLNSADAEFTVFAPTNSAFAALPAGTLDAVLADENLLTSILLYHVVGGRALAADVVGLDAINALRGGPIDIEVTDQGVILNGNIRITTTDIQATNGVIHVIDGVLIP
jgi:uncharacterized surface protein with fasciclin (FAS1) repeats